MKNSVVISWDKTRKEYTVRFMVYDTQVDVQEYRSIALASKSISRWTRGTE